MPPTDAQTEKPASAPSSDASALTPGGERFISYRLGGPTWIRGSFSDRDMWRVHIAVLRGVAVSGSPVTVEDVRARLDGLVPDVDRICDALFQTGNLSLVEEQGRVGYAPYPFDGYLDALGVQATELLAVMGLRPDGTGDTPLDHWKIPERTRRYRRRMLEWVGERLST